MLPNGERGARGGIKDLFQLAWGKGGVAKKTWIARRHLRAIFKQLVLQKNKVSECITFQSKNGLNVETLEKVVLLQKAAAAISISPDDLSAVMKLQNFLLEAGFSASEIAEAFAEVLGKEDSGVKLLAKQMLAALDHPRVREGDLSVGGQIAKAFDFAAVSFFLQNA